MSRRRSGRTARGFLSAVALGAVLLASGAAAQGAEPRLGPETNLPLPRFVTLNSAEANARRGPGLSHRIDWVFLRRGLPLEVLAEHGHWRKVVDSDGAGGWVHHGLLRGGRAAVITARPEAPLRAEPRAGAALVARAETGVIAEIRACAPDWCELSVEGVRGWAAKADFWGARPGEVFE